MKRRRINDSWAVAVRSCKTRSRSGKVSFDFELENLECKSLSVPLSPKREVSATLDFGFSRTGHLVKATRTRPLNRSRFLVGFSARPLTGVIGGAEVQAMLIKINEKPSNI